MNYYQKPYYDTGRATEDPDDGIFASPLAIYRLKDVLGLNETDMLRLTFMLTPLNPEVIL